MTYDGGDAVPAALVMDIIKVFTVTLLLDSSRLCTAN